MKVLVGDILKSKAQTLVNTVNCVGIMGKGIALEFKNRFPEMFKDYTERCARGEVKPGEPYLYKLLYPPQIVNFPTKDHWKSVARISDVEAGMKYLLEHYKEWGITSIAIPPLGCGNGQLEWRAVGPLIYGYAKQMDIAVEMYAPYGIPPKELTIKFLKQTTHDISCPIKEIDQSPVNPAWVALVEIVRRIDEQPYHWPVGRTIFQKIAYIATQQGLPTGFIYQKGSYGPFSRELKNAESKLINNNLLKEERLRNMFMVKVGPNFEKIKKDFASYLAQWETIIEKTTDLFMRMNTSQAEIVATVIFSADSLIKEVNRHLTDKQVLDHVMSWKQKRRPPIDRSMVAATIRNLEMLRWLDVKPDADFPVPEDECFPF
jgi:O-acetyl-ADP-ribose deacetylase (regulator of RNase III)/uncharacterized protein YwgA